MSKSCKMVLVGDINETAVLIRIQDDSPPRSGITRKIPKQKAFTFVCNYKATLCFSDKLGKKFLPCIWVNTTLILPLPPRQFYSGNEAHLSNVCDLLKNTNTSIFHTHSHKLLIWNIR